MRVGLIGLGAAGASHLDVLAKLDVVEVAGIADLDGARVAELRAKYDVPVGTTNHRELLDDPRIDFIAIAAGDRAHYPLVMDCAAAGKPVICEKPIATELAHGAAMVEAMRRAGQLFCITFNNRAGVITRRIRELVRGGAVGTVRMVRLVGLMAAPDNRHLRESMGPAAARARAQNICVDGKNALFDCGVHSFDFARWLTGAEFERIEARGWAMRGFPYPDHGVALCTMTGGISALIEKSFVYAYEAQTRKEYVRYDIIGDGGSIAWDLDTQTLHVFGRDQTLHEPLPHGGKGDVRTLLYQGFVESLRAGRLHDWLASGEDGLRAIEAAQRATDAMLAAGVVRHEAGRCANWWEG